MARFSSTGGGSGIPGPMGPEGDSAYEVAVANGFIGTEQEWLDSLGGGTANIADFVFTDNIEDGNSTMTLSTDKEMVIFAGANNDLYLNAGDDLYLTSTQDDIHVRAGDDIRFTVNYNTEEGQEYYWRMDSEAKFQLPGEGYIENPMNSSGDGYGNDTLKLVPDADLEPNDQYLIIDPTQPNHIHIRAGGTQDASNAELILGGENTHVRVIDSYSGIVINAADISINSQSSPSALNINTYSGATINSNRTSTYEEEDKVVATLGDISAVAPIKTRFSPVFQATGLTFTGSGNTYPTYDSWYVKYGDMVTFNIKCVMATVTNFGTGQLKLELPFAPLSTAANHFSAWCWVDPSQPADELNGHVQLVADHLPNSQVLDLHWLKETTATPKPLIESILSQGTPITFTTSSVIYVNGTYIAA